MKKAAFAFALLLTTSLSLTLGHPVHSLPQNKEALSAQRHLGGYEWLSLHRGGNGLAASQRGGDRVGNGLTLLP